MANLAAGGYGEKTACVEICGHGQLSQWKAANDEGYFKEQRVYYYPNFCREQIPQLINMDYDKIIMDFGDAYLSCREEIMRCDTKIFLLNLNPWQKFAAQYLVRTVKNEEWGQIRPIFGTVLPNEAVKREVEREFQVQIQQVPLLQEPCCIPGSAFAGLQVFLDSKSAKRKKKWCFPCKKKV